MSLRILLCTHAPADPRTAVYQSYAKRAQHMRSHGHQVDVMTPDDLLARRPARLDPFLLPILIALRRLDRYDVIVFHSYLGWAYHLLRAAFGVRRRIATMTTFHGLEPLYLEALDREAARQGHRLSIRFRAMHSLLRRLLRASCRNSDAVLCLNSLEAEYLTRHGWVDANRVYLVPNGVERECFVQRDRRTSARRILFVGQWFPAKGIRYLVDAFAALAGEVDLELVCAGTRASSETVLAWFPSAVRARVTVVPDVDRKELYHELSAADLFVFPSLSEGFSIALLEAMAAGLPIVATPAGAAVDVLIDGHNALLVPCADASSIVTAVQRLLKDVQLRDRLGDAARATAARYTVEAAGERFLAMVVALAHHYPRRDVSGRCTDEDLVA